MGAVLIAKKQLKLFETKILVQMFCSYALKAYIWVNYLIFDNDNG